MGRSGSGSNAGGRGCIPRLLKVAEQGLKASSCRAHSNAGKPAAHLDRAEVAIDVHAKVCVGDAQVAHEAVAVVVDLQPVEAALLEVARVVGAPEPDTEALNARILKRLNVPGNDHHVRPSSPEVMGQGARDADAGGVDHLPDGGQVSDARLVPVAEQRSVLVRGA